jgi:hypothetical protein
LRVNRFAAAIDMTAAGTSAPMAIAANATPRNQDARLSEQALGRLGGPGLSVDEVGDPGGQRDPGELVPVEEREPEEHRVLYRVQRRIEQP